MDDLEQAQDYLRRIEHRTCGVLVGIAEVHVVRGDFSEAMVWLRRAVLDRNFALVDVAREELFVDLQEHLGYRELVSEYVGDG